MSAPATHTHPLLQGYTRLGTYSRQIPLRKGDRIESPFSGFVVEVVHTRKMILSVITVGEKVEQRFDWPLAVKGAKGRCAIDQYTIWRQTPIHRRVTQ